MQPAVRTLARPPAGTDVVIFDFDGTLVDSADLNYWALQTAVRPEGVSVSWSWYVRRVGLSLDELTTELAVYSEHAFDTTVIRARHESYVVEHLADLKARPLVAALAEDLSRDFRLAVGSGQSSTALVRRVLGQLALDRLFEVVVTRGDVRAGKPAPDIFLEAARRLDGDPARTHVYEDTDEGLRAARAAGMSATDVRAHMRSTVAPIATNWSTS